MVRIIFSSLLPALFAFSSSTAASPVASSHPHPKGWHTLSPIPLHPRQEHSTVALSDTSLAILGGIIPNEDQTGHDTTAIVQVYDIPTDTWRTVAPLPLPFNHPNAAVVDGRIYVLGGLRPNDEGAWRAVRDCWVYDPSEDEWTALEDMPEEEERGSATMGVHGSEIILAGGMRTLVPGPGGLQDTVGIVTAYDTLTGEWRKLPDLPEERDHAGTALVNGKMYVLGGRREGQIHIRDTVFSLDLQDDEAGDWVEEPTRLPTPRGGLATGTVSFKPGCSEDGDFKTLVYTMGGEGNPAEGAEGVFNQTEVFDPQAGTWVKMEKMPVAKHGTMAVGIGRAVYVPGGGVRAGGSPVSSFEVLYV